MAGLPLSRSVLSSDMLDPNEIAPESPRLLSREEYRRLVELGMFAGERVELLYGTVVEMSPHGPAHDETVNALDEHLARALGGRAKVRVQSAFAASDGSEPEPDVTVVPRRSYRESHPTEAWLVIEVAESSLPKDRGPKARLYAQSSVEEYWIVNLVDQTLLVHRQPTERGYDEITTHRPGDVVRLLRFPDVEVPVSSMFA